MNHFPRLCAYCEEPLEGRADKLYCSSSCKSKDFRRQQAGGAREEELPPPTGTPGPYAKVALRTARDWDAGDEDEYNDEDERDGAFEADADDADDAGAWGPPRAAARPPQFDTREQLQQAVQHAMEQYDLQQLPSQYAVCVEQVLAADEHLLTGRDLERLGAAVRKTLAAYTRAAVGPDRPAFVAAHLPDLYRVEELVEQARRDWYDAREPVELPLKKKLRARLRTALALIARP